MVDTGRGEGGFSSSDMRALRQLLGRMRARSAEEKRSAAELPALLSKSDTLETDSVIDDFEEVAPRARCFENVCNAAGVTVPSDVNCVCDLPDVELGRLAAKKQYKVVMYVYGETDVRNHLVLVRNDARTALIEYGPVSEGDSTVTICCTTMEFFFNKSNRWAHHEYYADDDDDDRFGGDLRSSVPRASQPQPTRQPVVGVPPSIHDESNGPGGSNISGGVVRAHKRVVAAKKGPVTAGIAKNYRVSNLVQFNNVDEVFQDSISREYAQEILEAIFEDWGIPLEQPNAARYAEDLVWAFIIGTTASNKADWSRAYAVPVEPVTRHGELVTEVEASMVNFSVLLESKFGVSRRQFARGVADDLRAYLKNEENVFMLPILATRIGCEPMLAHLAFDGSTHCSNMTTREVTFTKTLESRALFERDDIIAEGASDRLMQGFSGGVRSKVPR